MIVEYFISVMCRNSVNSSKATADAAGYGTDGITVYTEIGSVERRLNGVAIGEFDYGSCSGLF